MTEKIPAPDASAGDSAGTVAGAERHARGAPDAIGDLKESMESAVRANGPRHPIAPGRATCLGLAVPAALADSGRTGKPDVPGSGAGEPFFRASG
ncbi:MAG: hypothetical protein LBT40_03265, partial [Deltaproteobacteria bacterium]|nr:hypothetical protein [Deltaproteobacteria bacterium]